MQPAHPVVYTIRGCSACLKLLKKWDDEGLAYQERRVELDRTTLDEARGYGSLVPIVVWPDGRVEQGFGDMIGKPETTPCRSRMGHIFLTLAKFVDRLNRHMRFSRHTRAVPFYGVARAAAASARIERAEDDEATLSKVSNNRRFFDVRH